MGMTKLERQWGKTAGTGEVLYMVRPAAQGVKVRLLVKAPVATYVFPEAISALHNAWKDAQEMLGYLEDVIRGTDSALPLDFTIQAREESHNDGNLDVWGQAPVFQTPAYPDVKRANKVIQAYIKSKGWKATEW